MTGVGDMDADRRFGAMSRLYGVAGAKRIVDSHIVVVGIGGVGSWAAEALARSAVGRLTLVDMDHIAESNINRQVHALTDTLGQAKVLAMQERIFHINPACQVGVIDDFVTPQNWPHLLPASVTGVIDACDQMSAKFAMAEWALTTEALHFVTVGAAGGKRQAHLVEIDDLAKTTHDPLLAQLRYRLRRFNRAPEPGRRIGLNCVFSREAVRGPQGAAADLATLADHSLNCHGYGSSVGVTATFGMCAANWMLDKIASQTGRTVQNQATI